ncbi:MAG TPA: ankyrin repeat domain-containing protein [Bryobacteraceae bacterium]|jgi:ankyrin repeat protein|nr:ankyrin repeat domain-containing protein [Bryobacteraceae bacterium]
MSKDFFDAIRAGDRERLTEMIAADEALLRAKDENGIGPFIAAKYSGRNDIAELLLQKGVELDIFAACMAGALQRVAELAREEPALIKSYSQDGWTPLHLACFFNQPAIAEALILEGADVQARSRNAMKNAPLHAAAAGRSRESVRILIEHGADVNAKQEAGWTALHAASQNGDIEMVRLLIAGGAHVHARAENNQNALDLAMTKGHQAVVDILDVYAASEGGAS